MLKDILNTAKLIFTDTHTKELEKQTSENHRDSSKIMYRDLNEISTKFEITDVYSMQEEYEHGTEKVKYYSFEKSTVGFDVKKSFLNNDGTLFLVDEKEKIKINKQFRFIPDYSRMHDLDSLNQSPDFVYVLGDNHYWVIVEPKRNETQELEYTDMLKLLYQVLSNSKSIHIDADFSNYGSTINEKWYDLIRFRLDRQSLFLVFEDNENSAIFSHEFKNINSVKMLDLEDRLKIWLYMSEGTHRFYLPFNRKDVMKEYIHLDPILYRN